MSSRFTETEKWKDVWFRRLSIEAKVLFQYLCDNCDIAGFWEIDLDLASYFTGIPTEENMPLFKDKTGKSIEAAFKELARGYIGGNSHIFIRTFLVHQKNLPLNPENCAHRGIIQRINSHNSLGEKVLEEIAKQIKEKGLQSPLGIGKGIGKKEGVGEKKTGRNKSPAVATCIVDKKPYRTYQKNQKGEPVYLCDDCIKSLKAMNVTQWGYKSPSEIEKLVEHGKAKINKGDCEA